MGPICPSQALALLGRRPGRWAASTLSSGHRGQAPTPNACPPGNLVVPWHSLGAARSQRSRFEILNESESSFFFFFNFLFLTTLGLCCCVWAFSGWVSGGCSQAAVCGSFSAWTWLHHSICDLLGPGIEPVFPTVAGGFLTTGPPGKSWIILLENRELLGVTEIMA